MKKGQKYQANSNNYIQQSLLSVYILAWIFLHGNVFVFEMKSAMS